LKLLVAIKFPSCVIDDKKTSFHHRLALDFVGFIRQTVDAHLQSYGFASSTASR
jgi:hypothetical protein